MSISSRSSAYWKRSLHPDTDKRICAFVYITALGCCRCGALKTSAVWQNCRKGGKVRVTIEDCVAESLRRRGASRGGSGGVFEPLFGLGIFGRWGGRAASLWIRARGSGVEEEGGRNVVVVLGTAGGAEEAAGL